MSISGEVVEVAARAMFAEEQCDRVQKLDVDSNWIGRLDDMDREEYRRLASAVLASLRTQSAVERVAEVIFEQVEPGLTWDTPPSEDHRELYREVAKAALGALAPIPEQDQLRRIPSYSACATCDGGGCGDCS